MTSNLYVANPPAKPIICSFCGKLNEEVEQMIAGVVTYICNECVVAALEVIDRKRMTTPLTDLRARLAAAEAERMALKLALRAHALVRRERMTYGGGFAHVGFACKACNSDWDIGEPERHKDGCLVALRPPPPKGEG